MTAAVQDLSFRRGTPADARDCVEVMWTAVTDLGIRHGTPLDGTAADWWTSGEPLQRYLAIYAAEWWVAEAPGGGPIVGYARSIERGGLLELTEFFVVPEHQTRGVGRGLLERAFPEGRGEIRSIIATTDVRALANYYRAGLVARFPMLSLAGVPSATEPADDLTAQRLDAPSEADLAAIREIDRSVLDHARDAAEIRWLIEDREGYLYRRGTDVVGFGFVGKGGTGPIASSDAADQPDMLRHIEGRAASLGISPVEFQVPAPNEVATRHLLSRGFRLDPWINLLMSNRPFGHFDRLVTFGPPLFL